MLNGIKIDKKWKLTVPFTKKHLTNNIHKKKLGRCMKTWVIFQQMHLCSKCYSISTVICFSENNVTAYKEENSRVLTDLVHLIKYLIFDGLGPFQKCFKNVNHFP